MIHTARILRILLLTGGLVTTGFAEWLNTQWHYRIPITVEANGADR